MGTHIDLNRYTRFQGLDCLQLYRVFARFGGNSYRGKLTQVLRYTPTSTAPGEPELQEMELDGLLH